MKREISLPQEAVQEAMAGVKFGEERTHGDWKRRRGVTLFFTPEEYALYEELQRETKRTFRPALTDLAIAFMKAAKKAG